MSESAAPSYLVVIERADDGGFGAWAPDLPGCVALGDTIEDAEQQMRGAIAFHLEGLRELGQPVPAPTRGGGDDGDHASGVAATLTVVVSAVARR